MYKRYMYHLVKPVHLYAGSELIFQKYMQKKLGSLQSDEILMNSCNVFQTSKFVIPYLQKKLKEKDIL